MHLDRDQPDCKCIRILNLNFSLKHAIDEMKLVSSFEKGKVNPDSGV